MNLVLYWFPTSKEKWLDEVVLNYSKKISSYSEFQVIPLKPKKMGRDSSSIKIKHEEEVFLNKISDSDYLIIFDEKGTKTKSSIEFSECLVRALESSKQRVIFLIGGAFGIGDKVRERANLRISLSNLTMSHQIAMTVCLEQIYRAFTIWKNQPYHNA